MNSGFTDEDNVLLLCAVMDVPDFQRIERGVVFSKPFSAAQLERQWERLLKGEVAVPDTPTLRANAHRLTPVTYASAEAREVGAQVRVGGELLQFMAEADGEMTSAERGNGPMRMFAASAAEAEERNVAYAEGMHVVGDNVALCEDVLKVPFEPGVVARLVGKGFEFGMMGCEIVIGRKHADGPDVDVDLASVDAEKARKVSKKQAVICFGDDEAFYLRNVGRNSVFVNGREVAAGKKCRLAHQSFVEIGGIPMLFELNYG